MATHTPHATRHTPHATRHTPHATRHAPHATRHTPHATRDTPHTHRDTHTHTASAPVASCPVASCPLTFTSSSHSHKVTLPSEFPCVRFPCGLPTPNWGGCPVCSPKAAAGESTPFGERRFFSPKTSCCWGIGFWEKATLRLRLREQPLAAPPHSSLACKCALGWIDGRAYVAVGQNQ